MIFMLQYTLCFRSLTLGATLLPRLCHSAPAHRRPGLHSGHLRSWLRVVGLRREGCQRGWWLWWRSRMEVRCTGIRADLSPPSARPAALCLRFAMTLVVILLGILHVAHRMLFTWLPGISSDDVRGLPESLVSALCCVGQTCVQIMLQCISTRYSSLKVTVSDSASTAESLHCRHT